MPSSPLEPRTFFFFNPGGSAWLTLPRLQLSSLSRPSSGGPQGTPALRCPTLTASPAPGSFPSLERKGVCLFSGEGTGRRPARMEARARAREDEAERVRWCVEGERGDAEGGEGRMARGSGPEPLPSCPFSPWTSSTPTSPCARSLRAGVGSGSGAPRAGRFGAKDRRGEDATGVGKTQPGKMETGPGVWGRIEGGRRDGKVEAAEGGLGGE